MTDHTPAFPGCVITTDTGRRYAVYAQRAKCTYNRFMKLHTLTVTAYTMAGNEIQVMNQRVPVASIVAIDCYVDSAVLHARLCGHVDMLFGTIARRMREVS